MFILSIPDFRANNQIISALDSFDENDAFTTYKSTAPPTVHRDTYIVHVPAVETTIGDELNECYQLLPNFLERSWPSSTNVRCWWCTHNFNTMPIPLPIGIKADGKYKVKGCFCSFNCSMAFALHEKQDGYLLGHLQKKLTGKPITTPIPPAPSRYCLREYGGPCTIDEFRTTHNQGAWKIDTSLSFPQIINCNDFITKKLTRQQYPGLEMLHEKMAKTTSDWKKRVVPAQPTTMVATTSKTNVQRNPRKAISMVNSGISRQHDSIGLKVLH